MGIDGIAKNIDKMVMYKEEGFQWNFTRQQNEMIKCIGNHYTRGSTPLSLESWCFIWAMEVSPRIPVASILKVYDWMKETGYYDYEVLL